MRQNLVRETDKGVLPVQINLPLVGQVLHFQRLMVTEESSTMEITVSSKTSQRWFGWMLFGLALMVGALWARQPKGWRLLFLTMALLWLGQSLLPAMLKPMLNPPWQALEICLGLWLLINLEGLMKAISSRFPARHVVLPDEPAATSPEHAPDGESE